MHNYYTKHYIHIYYVCIKKKNTGDIMTIHLEFQLENCGISLI